MSKHKHTPGPWQTVETIGGYALVATRDGVLIAKGDCSISSNHWVKNIAESNANARLIAAAPEMLEALEYFVGCDDDGDWDGNKAVTMAKSAIAKALGIPV